MNTQKSILVTGATGSVGSVLVKRLREAGEPVRVVVRNPDRATSLRNDPNVEVIYGDLTKPDSLRGCAENCSHVYHCAAVLGGSNWTSSTATNVTGTQAIVDEVVRAGVERLVYTSTIGVYGVCDAEFITEDTPWSAYHLPYFETKQKAERTVWEAASQIPVSIARLGDMIGPGQQTWTVEIMKNVKQGLLKIPLETQSGYLNPIYIDNLIDALVLIGNHPAAVGQVFNVVDGFPIRASDYFRRYYQMAGKRATALPATLLKLGAAALMGFDLVRGQEVRITPGVIDYLLRSGKIFPTRLRNLLGWAPVVSQEEAFACIEQWLRSEGYLE